VAGDYDGSWPLGGPDVAATGFAIGMERLRCCAARGQPAATFSSPCSTRGPQPALALAQELREAGLIGETASPRAA
jgi:histidyl-tRNA synthetase